MGCLKMTLRTESNPFSEDNWSLNTALNSLFKRHQKQLKPCFFSKESTVKIAGAVFAGLTIFSTLKTVHGFSNQKSSLFGHSLSTVFLAASTFFCFHKKIFGMIRLI